jgi:hypothetical protein
MMSSSSRMRTYALRKESSGRDFESSPNRVESRSLSAVLSGKYKADSGKHIGVVISGGNTVAVNFQNP